LEVSQTDWAVAIAIFAVLYNIMVNISALVVNGNLFDISGHKIVTVQ